MFKTLLKSIVTNYNFSDSQIGGEVSSLEDNNIYYLENELVSTNLGTVPNNTWYYIKMIDEDINNIIIYNSEKESQNLEYKE